MSMCACVGFESAMRTVRIEVSSFAENVRRLDAEANDGRFVDLATTLVQIFPRSGSSPGPDLPQQPDGLDPVQLVCAGVRC
jgi:hypothetical protein